MHGCVKPLVDSKERIEIALRIREARIMAGYVTQIGFAQAVGVSPVTACQWETGKRLPATEELIAVARLTGASIDGLVFGGELFR